MNHPLRVLNPVRLATRLVSLSVAACMAPAGAFPLIATSGIDASPASAPQPRTNRPEWRAADAAFESTPAASPRVVAKVSGPVSTLFGIPVGARLPGSPLAQCTNDDAAPSLPCRDREAERTAIDPARRDATLATLTAAGMRWMVARIDDKLVNTMALRGMEPRSRPAEIVVDGADSIQYVSFAMPVYARERVLALLSAKYGKPMRIESFGVPVSPAADLQVTSPAYFWEFVNVTIEYRSQSHEWAPRVIDDESSRHGEGVVGRISVFLPTFEDHAARLAAAHRPATLPVRR